MVATLDLDPQDGDTEFLEDIEAVFEISLTQQDVGHWVTLGDVHDTLLQLLPIATADGVCPTAMTFYRLRRSLMSEVTTDSIRPSTLLAPLVKTGPSGLLTRLKRDTGLRMPPRTLTSIGMIGFCLLLAAIPAALFAGSRDAWVAVTAAALGIALGAALIAVDRGEFPAGLVTIGDLARRVAGLNRPLLRKQGARQMPNGVWETLVALAADHSGLGASEIGPETHLFENTLKTHRTLA